MPIQACGSDKGNYNAQTYNDVFKICKINFISDWKKEGTTNM